MSKLLRSPKVSQTLDRVRIASIKIEENPYIGQRWVEFWLTIGRLTNPADESSFIQHRDPDTGEDVFTYLKIENGMNPLQPGMALGKCGDCGAWAPATSGECAGCGGTISPYDGWTRLVTLDSPNDTIRGAIAAIAYGFLTTEEVPDPETWEPKKLLDVEP
jgi:hypothetical protein